MIRTMIYLPDELHKTVKHLAIARGTSMAKLVAEAVEALCSEDVEDVNVARERMESYSANPAKAVSYASYRAKRLKK